MSQTPSNLPDAPVEDIGVNPFSSQLQIARTAIIPHFPSWSLNVLILLAVIRGIIILSCISIMVIPLFKGAASRKRHYTLIRRVYPQQGKKTPYLVPNRCMIIAICETMSGTLYILSAIGSYEFYSGGKFLEGPMTYISTWYGLEILPGYIGIWLSGWSLVHACLCDLDGKKNSRFSRFLTPSLYNSLWILGTALVIAVHTYWAFRTTVIFSQLESAIHHAFRLLERAVKVWDTNHNISGIPVGRILVAFQKLNQYQDPLKSTVIGWAGTWASFLIVLTIFYLVTVRLLLRMLRHVLQIRDSEAMSMQAQSPLWIELEKETRFLSFLSVAVTLSVAAQICVAILQAITGAHLLSLEWRMKSALLNHVPGIFMVPAQLIQSWRILCEKTAADESDFHMIPMDFKDREIPQMTSQLLGWDTTIYWGEEPSMKANNFPGLCEVSSNESDVTPDPNPQKKSGMNIQVIQSTVIIKGTV
ncbi:hypothetical protein DFH28DRAFT_536396 [Melampsora americana]|nr:hypothetical protein DFH28DRAFT_536396 [Melampsora americana]